MMRQIVAMPWGGDRNIALRVELDLQPGEIGMLNAQDALFVVVRTERRANEISRHISRCLKNKDIFVIRRKDGRYLVTGNL